MNTLGKLLVIVNLLFAVATGAFLVVDFAKREQWHKAYEDRDEELKVMRYNTEADAKTKQDLVAQMKRYKEELDAFVIQNRLEQSKLHLVLQKKEDAYKQQKEVAEKAVVNSEMSTKEAERLGMEIRVLNDNLKKRQDEIAELQKTAAQSANRAIESDSNAKKATERALTLLSQVTQLTKKVYELEIKLAGGDNVARLATPVRDRNYENPPRVNVKGLIDRVDKQDPTLVQITLGSDAGLEQNNTLEVYRLSPQPEYLGRLRLTAVYAHAAVGRIIRPVGLMNADAPRPGDHVATKILP